MKVEKKCPKRSEKVTTRPHEPKKENQQEKANQINTGDKPGDKKIAEKKETKEKKERVRRSKKVKTEADKEGQNKENPPQTVRWLLDWVV